MPMRIGEKIQEMLRKINQSPGRRGTGAALTLSILSGILLILSFPGFNLWILAWFAFVPIFFTARSLSKLKTFLLFYLCGLIFWFGTIYWLVHVTLLGLIILVLYLSLYFGFLGLIFKSCRLLFIPAAWVVLEYIRAHLFTGFPWELLGYSQYLNLPVIQIADITGVYGVSFLIMLANISIYSAVSYQPPATTRIKKMSPFLIVIFITLAYGYFNIYRLSTIDYQPSIKVSVIQANIPQELKWNPNAKSYILRSYELLSEEAAKDKPELIVWPEAASPGIPGEDDWVFEGISGVAKKLKTPLLIGSVTKEGENYFNSALLINREGKISGRYDKLHLVPFGEYIPLKKYLPFLETVVPIGDITPGKDYKVFTERGAKFGVLICFEDLFPELSRQFIKSGAGFLINITNDAWYKETQAGYQHLQCSVFRAVENRVFVVRSANTGVSAFINSSGEIISTVRDNKAKEIFVRGIASEKVSFVPGKLTFYCRFADIFVLACIIFIFCAIIPLLKKIRTMKKIFLLLLIILIVFLAIGFLFFDRKYFLCPIDYHGDFVVRNDGRGDGSFGAERNGRRLHNGIDLLADIGTPVMAARSGTVVSAQRNHGMGNYVIIKHHAGLSTIYGHLQQILVKKGQHVRQGHIIGTVGKTGNAAFKDILPHLHFEVRKEGLAQDPLDYLE